MVRRQTPKKWEETNPVTLADQVNTNTVYWKNARDLIVSSEVSLGFFPRFRSQIFKQCWGIILESDAGGSLRAGHRAN